MNEKIKALLIKDHGLKADATLEEAEVFAKEKNITIVDATEPVEPVVEPVVNIDFSKAIKALEDTMQGKLDTIETSQATMNLQMKDNRDEDPMCGYRNNAEYFLDVMEAGKSGAPSDKLQASHEISLKNAVGSDEAKVANNPDGGFLIPKGVMPGVMETDGNATQFDTGTRTRNIPMATNLVSLNARVDKNHSSSVSGGFQVYRRAETETVTASKAQFEQIDLKADSLMGLAYASKEILALSPISFAALINSGFEDERISKLNDERLRGTGVGEYMGIYNSPALVTQAKKSAQAADTIVGENLTNMRSRIYGYNNAIWMTNLDCYAALTTAHISGTNGDVFLFAPGNGVDVPDTILGRPVVFDENMSTLGDLGDIALVNWNEYLEGQVGGASFAESVHVRFVYNETAFKFDVMNAGAPWWRTALTPKQSTVTLSPFVTLAART